jgi:cytochrome oxidase assembly protein ShyY1
LAHPLHLIAENAWHGGGWNAPYTPDSTGVGVFLCYLITKFAWAVVLALGFIVYFRKFLFNGLKKGGIYILIAILAFFLIKKFTKKREN